MVVMNGRFDGKNVVLDEPVPEGIPVNAPVKVVFEGEAKAQALAEIAQLAEPGGLPRDYAQQHEHYTKGTQRR